MVPIRGTLTNSVFDSFGHNNEKSVKSKLIQLVLYLHYLRFQVRKLKDQFSPNISFFIDTISYNTEEICRCLSRHLSQQAPKRLHKIICLTSQFCKKNSEFLIKLLKNCNLALTSLTLT